MKHKIIGCILIFIGILTISFGFTIERHAATFESNDNLRKLLELNLKNNPLTMGMSVYNLDIYHDTLYVVWKHNLIQISLKTGKTSKNLKVSNFLNNTLKSNVGVGKIVVKENGYYLSYVNEIFLINRSGKANRIYDNRSTILDFNILGNKIILASRDDGIKLVNEKGMLISTLKFELGDAEYIPFNNGLCYSSASQDYNYEFKVNINSKLIVEKYAPISLTKEIKDPDIAYDIDRYFVAFAYYQRTNLYIVNKNPVKNQIWKTISLDQSYIENTRIMDEGHPDFRIAVRENINYLTLVRNNKLEVFTFNF